MAKRLTLEERAERKFPLDSYASEKERSSILAMRKAWVKVEQVKAEASQKKKRLADRDALKLGKEIQKRYPGLTVGDIAIALDYCRHENLEWFRHLCSNAYLIDKYITSRRNKKEQNTSPKSIVKALSMLLYGEIK